MFYVCILHDAQLKQVDKPWIEEYVKAITDITDSGNFKTLAYYAEHLSPAQFFFNVSQPNYLKINKNKIYLSALDSDKKENVFLTEEVHKLHLPTSSQFIAVKFEEQLIAADFAIDSVSAFSDFLEYSLLVFDNTSDFEEFSRQMDEWTKDLKFLKLVEGMRDLRKMKDELDEENQWYKNQAETLQTSLSLIRTEFQSDLKWYRDELEHVIDWYKKNYEELPRGFVRLGKGINALRKKLWRKQ